MFCRGIFCCVFLSLTSMEFILDFQAKVLENLNLCLAELKTNLESCSCAGVAVSGGADSISLLVALKKILNIQVKAVTVNHNIRSGEESSADADYVESVCRSLGVKCVRYNIAPGEILKKFLFCALLTIKTIRSKLLLCAFCKALRIFVEFL